MDRIGISPYPLHKNTILSVGSTIYSYCQSVIAALKQGDISLEECHALHTTVLSDSLDIRSTVLSNSLGIPWLLEIILYMAQGNA